MHFFSSLRPNSRQSNNNILLAHSWRTGGKQEHRLGDDFQIVNLPFSHSLKYLDFDNLPETNFTCAGKVIGGYYADLETSCQMFHVCTIGQLDEPMDIKFLCLNGTVFDQETRVCERVDEVDCTKSEKFYYLNLELYGNTMLPLSEGECESPEQPGMHLKQFDLADESSDEKQSEHSSSSTTTKMSTSTTTPKKIVTHSSSAPETTTHKVVTQNSYRPTLETPAIITSLKKPSSILTTTISSSTPHYLPSTHKPFSYDELIDDVDYEYDDDYFTTNSKELIIQPNQNQSECPLRGSHAAIHNSLFVHSIAEAQKADSHEHSPPKLFSQPVHFAGGNRTNNRSPIADSDYIDKPSVSIDFDIKRNNITHNVNVSNSSVNGVIHANRNYQSNANIHSGDQSEDDDRAVIKPAVSFQQQQFQNGGRLTVTNSHFTVIASADLAESRSLFRIALFPRANSGSRITEHISLSLLPFFLTFLFGRTAIKELAASIVGSYLTVAATTAAAATVTTATTATAATTKDNIILIATERS